jgi:hypothetical protein
MSPSHVPSFPSLPFSSDTELPLISHTDSFSPDCRPSLSLPLRWLSPDLTAQSLSNRKVCRPLTEFLSPNCSHLVTITPRHCPCHLSFTRPSTCDDWYLANPAAPSLLKSPTLALYMSPSILLIFPCAEA